MTSLCLLIFLRAVSRYGTTAALTLWGENWLRIKGSSYLDKAIYSGLDTGEKHCLGFIIL